MELKGKNILIVAGFGGIGLGICRALMSKKLKSLTILDRIENNEALKELQSIDPTSKVEYFKFDVTMEISQMQEALGKILQRIGQLDIFIYGAGICNESKMELTVQINLMGMIKMISLVLPYMDRSKGNNGGMIVNIASIVALEPFPVIPTYSATKAGVLQFTRALADPVIFDKTGVSMIAICPGVTETNIFNEVETFLNIDPNFTEQIVNIKGQSAAVCGLNIVKAIEDGRNNSIWILDDGQMRLAEPPKYDWNVSEINKILS